MGQLEYRNILKVELCNCHHFSLQSWGHVPALPVENLIALAYVCIHLKHPLPIIHYSHLSFTHKKTETSSLSDTSLFAKCPYVFRRFPKSVPTSLQEEEKSQKSLRVGTCPYSWQHCLEPSTRYILN